MEEPRTFAEEVGLSRAVWKGRQALRDKIGMVVLLAGLAVGCTFCKVNPGPALLQSMPFVLMANVISTRKWCDFSRVIMTVSTLAVALAPAFGEQKYVLALTILATACIQTRKMQLLSTWMICAAVLVPGLAGPAAIASMATALMGFEEDETIERTNEAIIALEKGVDCDDSLREADKPRLIRMLREVRNCNTARNKVGSVNAASKARLEFEQHEGAGDYLAVLDECESSIRDSMYTAKLQGHLSWFSSIIAASATVAAVINDNTAAGLRCHAPPPDPVPPTPGPDPKPDSKVVPFHQDDNISKKRGSDKWVEHEGLTLVYANGMNIVNEWVAYVNANSEQVKASSGHDRPREFGYDLIGAAVNSLKEGIPIQGAPPTPTEGNRSTYRTQHRPYMIKYASDPKSPAEGRLLMGRLISICEFAACMNEVIQGIITGKDTMQGVALVKGAAANRAVHDVSSHLRGAIIKSSSNPHLDSPLMGVQTVMGEVLESAGQDAQKTCRLLAPRAYQNYVRNTVYMMTGWVESSVTQDQIAVNELNGFLNMAYEKFGPLERAERDALTHRGCFVYYDCT